MINLIRISLWCLVLLAGVCQAKTSLVLSKAEHQVLLAANKSISAGDALQALQTLQAFNQEKHSKYAHALSWQMLGNIARSEKSWLKAKQHYLQALSLKSLPKKDQRSMQANLMQANYQLKDWQASIDHWLLWQKMIVKGKHYSFKAMDYLRASISYKELGQWLAARQNLLKALSTTEQPELSWYQMLLGFERELGNETQQIKVLKQLIEMAPLQSAYWLALAKVYEDKGDKEEANALLYSAFNSGALQNPGHIKWLANGLSKQGNPAAASKVLEISIEQQYLNDDASSQELLVHFYRLAKMFTQAIAVLHKSEPSDKKYQQLARLYYQTSQWQLAYNSAQQITSINAKNAITIEMLMALSALHLQQTKQANEHFSKVLKLDPSHAVAKAALANI